VHVGLTVLQAIALSGGTTRMAKASGQAVLKQNRYSKSFCQAKTALTSAIKRV
jgi:protein involved in polysaccharide export with SLBB domain